MVNHYYWYIFDEDFGPFFLRFGSYFPYNAKVCLNGHEWLRRQLTKAGIEYEALGIARLNFHCDGKRRSRRFAWSVPPQTEAGLSEARRWSRHLWMTPLMKARNSGFGGGNPS